MELLRRVRESGKCPPSLLSEKLIVNDGFDEAATKLLEGDAFSLRHDASGGFSELVQKACMPDIIPAPTPEGKKETAGQRRAILLAMVAATSPSSESVSRILDSGFLTAVKLWLDEIMSGTNGGVDFLIHLLTCIAKLPVTKTVVKNSGMGKAMGTITKHSICKGTPNESAIGTRVQDVKDAWNASVKALKVESSNSSMSTATKRPSLDSHGSSPDMVKRIKTEDTTVKKSFSSLVKKVSASSTTSAKPASGGSASHFAAKAKKSSQRVKWSDHFGGNLSHAKLVEGREVSETAGESSATSWSDRKKRDILKERDLLAKAKRAKLTDDDADMDFASMERAPPMNPKCAWNTPGFLPVVQDYVAPNLVSPEQASQNQRMATVPAAYYASLSAIPSSPAPLSEQEKAMDMTSQSAATVAMIPFLAPPEPVPAPAPEPAPYLAVPGAGLSAPPVAAGVATLEYVSSFGLPPILVGQPIQAVETIAKSPSLLTSLVDATGQYDTGRLLSLVQALSGTAPSPQLPVPTYNPTPGFGAPVAAPNYVGQSNSFSSAPPRNNFRGNSEGNLHISGYGPGTTQADIIALFSPYVQVDEVVMKGTFSFVNTSDPMNAQRAREALSGTLLGGMPVRINAAQRKNRDAGSAYAPSSVGAGMSTGFQQSSYGPAAGSLAPPAPSMGVQPPFAPVNPPPGGMQNVDHVRDDRGNAATKNLFVAGYGPGTTEQHIREIFSQHCEVIGVVMKNNFTFVNSSERASAVRARQMLMGTSLNGGTLRINFAKETGRLGTSFDLTYGKNTGPNRGPPPPPNGYYGRSF